MSLPAKRRVASSKETSEVVETTTTASVTEISRVPKSSREGSHCPCRCLDPHYKSHACPETSASPSSTRLSTEYPASFKSVLGRQSKSLPCPSGTIDKTGGTSKDNHKPVRRSSKISITTRTTLQSPTASPCRTSLATNIKTPIKEPFQRSWTRVDAIPINKADGIGFDKSSSGTSGRHKTIKLVIPPNACDPNQTTIVTIPPGASTCVVAIADKKEECRSLSPRRLTITSSSSDSSSQMAMQASMVHKTHRSPCPSRLSSGCKSSAKSEHTNSQWRDHDTGTNYHRRAEKKDCYKKSQRCQRDEKAPTCEEIEQLLDIKEFDEIIQRLKRMADKRRERERRKVEERKRKKHGTKPNVFQDFSSVRQPNWEKEMHVRHDITYPDFEGLSPFSVDSYQESSDFFEDSDCLKPISKRSQCKCSKKKY